jgi:hypothetical protein
MRQLASRFFNERSELAIFIITILLAGRVRAGLYKARKLESHAAPCQELSAAALQNQQLEPWSCRRTFCRLTAKSRLHHSLMGLRSLWNLR